MLKTKATVGGKVGVRCESGERMCVISYSLRSVLRDMGENGDECLCGEFSFCYSLRRTFLLTPPRIFNSPPTRPTQGTYSLSPKLRGIFRIFFMVTSLIIPQILSHHAVIPKLTGIVHTDERTPSNPENTSFPTHHLLQPNTLSPCRYLQHNATSGAVIASVKTIAIESGESNIRRYE